MSEHTIQATFKVNFTFPGLADGEQESAYPTFEIGYSFVPGRSAYTPRGEYAPIDPPEPPEVTFIEAKLIDGDGLSPPDEQVQDWAEEWLASDEGFSAACNHAEAMREPDSDEAYERMRDDRAFFGE